MAQKRMFSLSVVDTDNFLEMPISSRLLYYELGMRADDDGFVSNWKKILTFTGLKVDDMKVLIAKQFIIPFESGVIVIRHWRLNNYLQKDRVKPTVYKEELAQLDIDENNVYNLYTKCIYSIDKNSIDKNSIDKNRKEKTKSEIDELISSNFTDKEIIDAIYEFIKMRKAIKKPLTTRGLQLMIKKLYNMTTDVDEQIEILNNSIMNNWQGIFPLKQNKTCSFNDFEELYKEAKIQDEQTGNNTSNSTVSW